MAAVSKRLAQLEEQGNDLTAKQRVILLVQSQNRDGRPDLALKRGMNAIQAQEFERYIELLSSVTFQVGPMVTVLEIQAEALLSEADRLLSTSAAWDEACQSAPSDQHEAGPHWRRLAKVNQKMKRENLKGILADGKELLAWAGAIESLWLEVGIEFDGADLIRPETRLSLARGRAQLKNLSKAIGHKLPRDSQREREAFERLRGLVRMAYGLSRVGKERSF